MQCEMKLAGYSNEVTLALLENMQCEFRAFLFDLDVKKQGKSVCTVVD